MSHPFDTYRDAARMRFMIQALLEVERDGGPCAEAMDVIAEQEAADKKPMTAETIRDTLDRAMELANWENEG